MPISIDEQGAIFIDDARVAADVLPARLRADRRRSGEEEAPRIFLRADRASITAG